jgi:recombination protein RecT
MTTVTQAVATRDRSDQLVSWIRKQQDDIAMAAASHVKPSAIIRVTQGALRRDPKLLAAAIANPQSLLYALLDCARLGHEPDTDDYYLVPFGNEVTGIEGYKGIIERMYRAGAVSSVVAQVVRKSDVYRSRGENTPPLHEYDDFASDEDRGPLRGVYAYAVMLDGRYSQVIRMGRGEIMKHKAMSRGSDRDSSPWQVWEVPMWKKCPLRALEPYVPTSAEYRTAVLAGLPDRIPVPPAAGESYATGYSATAHAAGAPDEFVEAEIVEDEPAPATERPKPARRPARRKTAAEDDTQADPGPAPAGDEDPPGDPGTASPDAGQPHPQLLGVIAQHFDRLGITERDERLEWTSKLARRAVASSKELTGEEARAVAGQLWKCENLGDLTRLLADGEKPGGEGGE